MERVRAARGSGRLDQPVVVVLEGQARGGVEPGSAEGATVIHAPGSGDDTLIDVISKASDQVTLVTADRALRARAEALGAEVVGPRWLTGRLED